MIVRTKGEVNTRECRIGEGDRDEVKKSISTCVSIISCKGNAECPQCAHNLSTGTLGQVQGGWGTL